MKKPLKVVLLAVEPDRARTLFYADPAEDDETSPTEPPPQGFPARVKARLLALKSGWQHPKGRAARWGRRVWHWLHRFTHPDEELLARLRTAREVELHHSEALSAEEVNAAWAAFLASSRRRHWPWFLANLLVAPLSIVLAVLPGPNVIGYWFAYRALHHGLILRGLGKMRKGRVATILRPSGMLTPGVVPESAALEALGYDPNAVDEFLRRHRVNPRRPATVAPTESG